MSSIVYLPKDIPTGTTWVYKLNAADAIRQCEILGVTPATTLIENRSLLCEFLLTLELNGGVRPLPEFKGNIPELDSLDGDSSSTDAKENPSINEPPKPPLDSWLSDGNPGPSHSLGGVEQSKGPIDPEVWGEIIKATAVAVGSEVATAVGRAMATQPKPTSPPVDSPRCMDRLITDIPITSGSDPKRVVEFLIHVSRIQQLHLSDDAALQLAILPRTSQQLRSLWSTAISSKTTLAKLTADILDFFVPQRLRHTLVSDLVYRIQKPRESLAEFIFEIRELCNLLLPGTSDSGLLEIALMGLNQATRSRLAGFPAPTSIDDLLAFAPRIQVIQGMEAQTAAPTSQNEAQPRTRYQNNFQNRQSANHHRPRIFNQQQRPEHSHFHSPQQFNQHQQNPNYNQRSFNSRTPYGTRHPGPSNWRGGRM